MLYVKALAYLLFWGFLPLPQVVNAQDSAPKNSANIKFDLTSLRDLISRVGTPIPNGILKPIIRKTIKDLIGDNRFHELQSVRFEWDITPEGEQIQDGKLVIDARWKASLTPDYFIREASFSDIELKLLLRAKEELRFEFTGKVTLKLNVAIKKSKLRISTIDSKVTINPLTCFSDKYVLKNSLCNLIDIVLKDGSKTDPSNLLEKREGIKQLVKITIKKLVHQNYDGHPVRKIFCEDWINNFSGLKREWYKMMVKVMDFADIRFGRNFVWISLKSSNRRMIPIKNLLIFKDPEGKEELLCKVENNTLVWRRWEDVFDVAESCRIFDFAENVEWTWRSIKSDLKGTTLPTTRLEVRDKLTKKTYIPCAAVHHMKWQGGMVYPNFQKPTVYNDRYYCRYGDINDYKLSIDYIVPTLVK